MMFTYSDDDCPDNLGDRKNHPSIKEAVLFVLQKPSNNSLSLFFKDKETLDYVLLVCRRKGISLPDYIVDNFEWDDTLACLAPEYKGKITEEVCDGCEHIDICPDAVKKGRRSS